MLEWQDVTKDGGSPIYGYDVFCRQDNAEWVKLNEELLFTKRYSVTDLIHGSSYEFKIEATNEAGLKSNSNVASESLMLTPSIC